MTVVMDTRPYQSLNVTIYHFPFLNVQYTPPDSDRQHFNSGGLGKSLVEHKVSNWKSDPYLPTGRVLVKTNRNMRNLRSEGIEMLFNGVHWSPLDTDR